MNKTFLLACLALAMASCSSNGTTPLPQAASQSNVQNGWASTMTQAVPLGNARSSALPSAVRTMPLHVVVGLYLRDRGGAQELVRRQYAAGDASYHHWLTPAQFTASFAPSYRQAASVAEYLRSKGFTDVTIEPNRLIVSATGTVRSAEAAFNTSIRTTTAGGKLIYANVAPAQIPARFRGLVGAVLGLTNAYHMSTHLVKSSIARVTHATGTPSPCLEVVKGICEGGEYGPNEYTVAYDAGAKSCPKTCTGYRTSVAVMAEGNVSSVETDLRKAEAFWKLPAVPYSVRRVGVSSVDTSGIDEWDLDTQISSGIAGTVQHLYVYDTTSLTDSDIALEYSHWVNDDLTQAGNSSFGENESSAYADGSMMLDDEEFNQAAAQGMTMFASTGDNGEGCPVLAATGAPNTGVPEVCYPAASPYVVAVGGTTLNTTAVGSQPGPYYGEHVWVGTGGGYSKWESAPYWQSNGICAACNSAALRGIADISMC
ncbi:MAG: hypothetical protein JO199_13745, partial [Candidatus Eremiobacteraeota bacterium]|nr:hypothetical protein [Candidatus Eremiobacteraeota bacterium]